MHDMTTWLSIHFVLNYGNIQLMFKFLNEWLIIWLLRSDFKSGSSIAGILVPQLTLQE